MVVLSAKLPDCARERCAAIRTRLHSSRRRAERCIAGDNAHWQRDASQEWREEGQEWRKDSGMKGGSETESAMPQLRVAEIWVHNNNIISIVKVCSLADDNNRDQQ